MTDVIDEPANRSTTDDKAAWLTREQLYEMVWTSPMLRVGERLGVSSSYMARVCTELRVPRPPRGYWVKLEVGKALPKPALPDAMPGDITEWRPGDLIGKTERTARLRQRLASTSKAAKPASPVRNVGRRPRGDQHAPRRHPLLIGVEPFFERTRDSDTGILRPFKRLLVDILSSKDGLQGAIAAADRVFQALVSRGHRVTIAPVGLPVHRADVDLREKPRKNDYQRSAWSPERATLVYIGDVPIGLTLFEMTEATEMQYVGNSTYVPVSSLSEAQRRRHEMSRHWTTIQDRASGRLRLQAYCPYARVTWLRQWSEAKPGQLASMVPGILEELEAAAPKLAEQVEAERIKAEEEHRKWEEEYRRYLEAEALALREKRRQESRKDLIATIAAWDEARAVAAYLSEAERAAQHLCDEDRQRLLDRISVARELVGEVSPSELLLRWKSPSERG